jgi:chorismate dehydratase
MEKYKISVVSYYNTFPFIYGIENSEFIQNNSVIEKDYPSMCATKLFENKVDIGLVPVAILPKIKNYKILTDYCLATNGKVDTVLLVSDVPLKEIENIYLDYQSLTSINLAKILAKHFWKINPNWINAEKGYETNIKNKDGGIIIGDRAFGFNGEFKYYYDLGEEWKKYTSLPFVFAVWTANKDIDNIYVKELNKAFKFGYNNIDKVVLNSMDKISISTVRLKKYLTENIDFLLDENKKRSMNLFMKLLD